MSIKTSMQTVYSLRWRCKLLFSSYHSFHTIIHVLHQLNLRTTKSSLVRYIISMIARFTVLPVDTPNLYKVFWGNLLKFFFPLSKLRELDMDWGSQSSAKISGTRSYITKTFVMWKLSDLLNLTSSSSKPGENCTNVCTLLHGYDSELILFINPY